MVHRSTEVKKKHRDKYELYRQGDLPYFDYRRLVEKETVKAIVEKYGVFYEMET